MTIEVPELYLLVEKDDSTDGDYIHILGAFTSLKNIQDYLNKRCDPSIGSDLYWQRWRALDSYGLHSEGVIRRKEIKTYSYEVEVP
jgi:hypothetical protein